jgi:hypothetical protein
MPDGTSLWIVDQADVQDAGLVLGAGFAVRAARADCTGWNTTFLGSVIDPSPLEPDGLVAPLDPIETGTGEALYYEVFAPDPSQPLGLRALGVGLAPRDPSRGAFVPTSDLLWPADRPVYGTSALSIGGTVYAWGCKGAGFLSADCFVAKASSLAASSSAAYSYWAGDHWSTNADDAVAVAQAGSTVSVRPDPARPEHWLMTYVPPLGTALVVRSAIAPEGPWSAPQTLGECGIEAGAGAFCGGAQQHPELVAGGAGLVLTYDARTFATDSGAAPSAFWPRLAGVIPLPPALP